MVDNLQVEALIYFGSLLGGIVVGLLAVIGCTNKRAKTIVMNVKKKREA